jgi:hypothetical protein
MPFFPLLQVSGAAGLRYSSTAIENDLLRTVPRAQVSCCRCDVEVTGFFNLTIRRCEVVGLVRPALACMDAGMIPTQFGFLLRCYKYITNYCYFRCLWWWWWWWWWC